MHISLNGVLFAIILMTFASCNYTAKFKTTSEKRAFELPDETAVLLDKHSSLRYKKNFNKRVIQINGKAYIEVADIDEKKDFEIVYNHLIIKLVGDKFYFNVIKDENKVIFIPISGYGRVEVKDISDNNIMTIKEGHQLEYEENNKVLQIREVNDNHYLSWKNNALYFNNATLQEVVNTLGQEFDVQIKLSSNALKNCFFSDTIDVKNLDTALSAVTSATKSKLQKTDKSYVIVGDTCVGRFTY